MSYFGSAHMIWPLAKGSTGFLSMLRHVCVTILLALYWLCVTTVFYLLLPPWLWTTFLWIATRRADAGPSAAPAPDWRADSEPLEVQHSGIRMETPQQSTSRGLVEVAFSGSEVRLDSRDLRADRHCVVVDEPQRR